MDGRGPQLLRLAEVLTRLRVTNAADVSSQL
jgi:hypothetical protein